MSEQGPGTTRNREIRSFVRRTGRVTRSQARALEELWQHYGLPDDAAPDLDQVFGRAAPRHLEIGFGMGDTLALLAASHPERDYIGAEVHEAGIGRLLALAEQAGLPNLRIVRGDAVVLLRERLAAASLARILVFFPDPWPKKRHHKRRLIQPAFAALACRCLSAGGELHLATDWEPYAQQMLEVLDTVPGLRNLAGPGRYAPDPGERPPTKFQRRGERLGHGIFDLRYRREAGLTPA